MKPSTENKKNGKGATRIFKAFFCSIAGIKHTWVFESAFRQEVFLIMASAILLVFVKPTILDSLLFLIAACLLLITEFFNTTIELLSDRITLEDDPSIKAAKDIGSAAVFFALTMFFLVNIYIVFF